MKKYKVSLISLLCAMLLALCAFSFTIFASADEEPRTVSLNGTNVFYANVDGAEVTATRETSGEGDQTVNKDYALFKIGGDDGQEITFRKNLAYSWYEKNAEGNVVNGKFNITIGFKNADFEKFVIKFQSQQFAKTEDGITTNYLFFYPTEDKTGVTITVSDEEDAEKNTNSLVYPLTDRLEIKFGDFAKGNYDIVVNGNVAGQFKNVQETYSKYSSSSTSGCMPLTFSAKFAEDAAEGATADMALYQLNGQSFELSDCTVDDNGNVSGGYVQDTCAPVICLNSNVNYLNFGESISLDYQAIDVLASSPTSTVNYYILSATNYKAEDFNYENTESNEDGTTLFTEVSSSDTLRLLRDKDTFIPSYLLDGDNSQTDGYEVFGLAKIYIKVTDVSGTKSVSDNVFLDWYVADNYKVDIYNSSLKNDATKSSSFIKIVTDNKGASYAKSTDTTIDAYKQTIEEIVADYQAKIDAAIDEQNPDDKKLYAGSSNYFYLPEFSGYATDNLGGYTDLKYSIYYKTSTTNSNTSLAYNQLQINVTEADVTYKFTIYVTDAEGNSMVYPVENAAGDLVWEEISTSDIWDSKYADLLPFFEFEVSYKAATVEEPTSQTLAYVGSTYSSASFDINGITNTYSTSYKLYTFDRDAFKQGTGINLTYAQFVENVGKMFEDTYTNDNGEKLSTRQYFTAIKAKTDLKESDEEYDTQIAYAWSSSAISFVPQSTSEFYVVQLTLTDTLSEAQTKKYMAIRASETPDSLAGENNWLENNIPSVVLLSIAGVAFVALIVLLLIKPKDKGDIDTIDLDEEKSKKQKKAKKSKKAEELD